MNSDPTTTPVINTEASPVNELLKKLAMVKKHSGPTPGAFGKKTTSNHVTGWKRLKR